MVRVPLPRLREVYPLAQVGQFFALLTLVAALVMSLGMGRRSFATLFLAPGTCENQLRAQIATNSGEWIDLAGIYPPGGCLKVASGLAPLLRTCCVLDEDDADRSSCSPRADEDGDGIVDETATEPCN